MDSWDPCQDNSDSVGSQVHTMEKAMAPHSSTLAWKIPWTEEPGRLQSMGRSESDTTERLHFHFSLSCIGERNGNPLQCSCLENPRDRGAWWAAISGVAQSWTQLKRLGRRRQWQPTPVLLPGKSHGRRSLVGCSPWGRSESDTTERLHFHYSLSCIGEGNGTRPSVLAWKIPGMVEPDGLLSMGSHRVGHN